MHSKMSSTYFLLLLILNVVQAIPIDQFTFPAEYRAFFNSSFVLGYASAATQVEGAAKADGKTDSIWDTYARIPKKIIDGSTPEIGNDEYHAIHEIVALLKSTGVNSYRFSISWPRMVPEGFAETKINPLAVAHYNLLIDSLLKARITPIVTLYHWDLPDVLQKSYGGFLDTEKFMKDFLYFADASFTAFGDRVPYWITFNEPSSTCLNGYTIGTQAPGRCINPVNCKFGFSPLDLTRCVYTTLISHAHTVSLYRTKFAAQKGKISIALNSNWAEPLNPLSQDDLKAAQLQMDYSLGWYADPIYKSGDYPKSLSSIVGLFMPKISKEDQKLLLGSADFFALNHYTSNYVTAYTTVLDETNSYQVNSIPLFTKSTSMKDSTLIGPQAESEWLFDVPSGFKSILKYVYDRYKYDIMVTENGFSVKGEGNLTSKEALRDTTRINYYNGYLTAMMEACSEGVRVIGYVAWTLTDNWEWSTGFTNRFGVVFFDRTPGAKNLKIMKDSAKWLHSFSAFVIAKK